MEYTVIPHYLAADDRHTHELDAQILPFVRERWQQVLVAIVQEQKARDARVSIPLNAGIVKSLRFNGSLRGGTDSAASRRDGKARDTVPAPGARVPDARRTSVKLHRRQKHRL